MKICHQKLADGELAAPSPRLKDGTYAHLIKCCDCGLRHLMQYTVTKRGLRFRAWRINHGKVIK